MPPLERIGPNPAALFKDEIFKGTVIFRREHENEALERINVFIRKEIQVVAS